MSKKASKKKRFVVETVSTFAEVHIVYAKNEEEAKKIVAHSDYNSSKWLGQQIVRVNECGKDDIERYKQDDDYFFMGAASIDKDDYLVYTDLSGTEIKSTMPREFLGKI
jgi:hypothetical protein